MKKMIVLLANLFLLFQATIAQVSIIPFDAPQWNKTQAKETEFLGRKCLTGIALLNEVEFTNGIIEFDLAVNGNRSYPGVIFRQQAEGEYERFYIRPHLPGIFQNVVQYEGTFNGLDSWQLYYGLGKTSGAVIPVNEWIHVKVEVKDTQARLFLQDMSKPVLLVTDLAHGKSTGTLGVWGPTDGSAYFSNFGFTTTDSMLFPPVPMQDEPMGNISQWELSTPVSMFDQDMEVYPSKAQLQKMTWQKVSCLPSGLVDISRHYGRQGQLPDLIWAKSELHAETDGIKKLAFGYSDVISIFLNGKLLFTGNSEYTSRDANFQGIIGFNDYLFLPLKKGSNELLIAVGESFGGWGFQFRDAHAVFEKQGLTKVWEIKNKFRVPESVVYDPKRDQFYVSNYTAVQDGFISKISPDGEIEKLDWITGILQPTGVCIASDKLLIVGRQNLIEYDLEKNQITARYAFPRPVFPNDVCTDETGHIFVTDGPKGAIYKLESGQITEWLASPGLSGINGLIARNGKLYAGTSRDGSIKVIDQHTKAIETVFSFGAPTVMDGIAMDDKGNLLFSDNAGRLLRCDADGKTELLLNTKTPKINLADFEYIPEKRMLLIPTFYDNRLMLYRF